MKSYKSYFTTNRVWGYFRDILWFPVYIIAKIVPKKDIVIFGAMNGYAIADNSKYLFMNTYKKNYFWITKNKSILKIPIMRDICPVYAYSIKGILLQLFAHQIYYTHRIGDFIPPLVMGGHITALWHGVPFKKIGAVENIELQNSVFRNWIGLVRRRLFPYSYYMYCHEVYCPDEKFYQIFQQCFAKSHPKVVIQQYPRIMFCPEKKKQRKIIFCPTYRKNRDLMNILQSLGILDNTFIRWLVQNEISLVIRPHPIDVERINLNYLPHNIELDTSKDIYESIRSYPVLLTDYSSLMYDAECLGLRVLIIADDIEEYNEDENGLFEDFLNNIQKNHSESIYTLLPELEKIFQITHI